MRKKFGFGLIIVSCIAWAWIPIIPFLPLSTTEKIGYAGSLVVFAEVTWWVGLPFVGKETLDFFKMLWQKTKGLFNPH